MIPKSSASCYTVRSMVRISNINILKSVLLTFLLLPTWYTNFLFIHINYIKLNSSTCFERNPPIIRRLMQIVHMQPLVSSLSVSDRLMQPLRKGSFFIVTNLIHKFLVHSHKLHKIKFLYMFRVQSAHHQEVDANCTYAASGIVTVCKWPSYATAKAELCLSGCTRRSLAESDDTRGCIRTICVVDLLMISGLRSKHVEEFNFMLFVWMNKKFVYQVGNNKKV